MPARKKDPSVRARANKSSTAATLISAPKGQAPELPVKVDRDGNPVAWQAMTVQWWADLWAAPMAAEYHESDRHALFVLAALMDDFWCAPSPTARKEAATEIRLQRQAFGLTPYDRRRLEWTIETADEAKDRGSERRARRGAVQPKAGADPRSVLRAVN